MKTPIYKQTTCSYIKNEIKQLIFKRQKYVNCILDTSASMTGIITQYLEYLTFVGVKINLIQIDCNITSISTINQKKEFSIRQILCYGATEIQPAIDYIANPINKLNKFNTIILTDGYTDSLDFSKIKTKTVVLSYDILCNVKFDNNKLKQFVIPHTIN